MQCIIIGKQLNQFTNCDKTMKKGTQHTLRFGLKSDNLEILSNDKYYYHIFKTHFAVITQSLNMR